MCSTFPLFTESYHHFWEGALPTEFQQPVSLKTLFPFEIMIFSGHMIGQEFNPRGIRPFTRTIRQLQTKRSWFNKIDKHIETEQMGDTLKSSAYVFGLVWK